MKQKDAENSHEGLMPSRGLHAVLVSSCNSPLSALLALVYVALKGQLLIHYFTDFKSHKHCVAEPLRIQSHDVLNRD